MKSLVGHRVFTVNDTAYCWEDVVVAAAVWQEWSEVELATRAALACDRLLATSALEPPRGQVHSAEREFRSTRRLFSATDTHAWLRVRGTSIDELRAYLERSVARRLWPTQIEHVLSRHAPSEAEVLGLLRPEAICGGLLERWAQKLARRAVALAVLGKRGPKEAGAGAGASRSAPTMTSLTDLLGLSPAVCEHLAARQASVDLAYAHYPTEVRERDIARELATNASSWVRVTYLAAVFPTEQAALEAVLCVRDDGGALEGVADSAGTVAKLRSSFLSQAPMAMRDDLLSARSNEVLGPFDVGHGFAVLQLRSKAPPSGSDPRLLVHVRRCIGERALAREVAERVVWVVR